MYVCTYVYVHMCVCMLLHVMMYKKTLQYSTTGKFKGAGKCLLCLQEKAYKNLILQVCNSCFTAVIYSCNTKHYMASYFTVL